jgi:beta-lactamase class D
MWLEMGPAHEAQSMRVENNSPREDVDGMRILSVWAMGCAIVALLAGSANLDALNAPRSLHRLKAEPHLSQSRHAATARPARRSSARAAASDVQPSKGKARAHGKKGRAAAVAADDTFSALPRSPRARRAALRARRSGKFAEVFTASSFVPSGSVGLGDNTVGEDPVVRQAAVEALGSMNGTAVVINANNGRILAMVNQKLALSPGAEPCSTIKITVAMAALSEGIVTRDTPVALAGGGRMSMTQALAHSNNLYFESLGRMLGFERMHHYANQFGLGELAGYNIPGERLGQYPDHELPVSEGGVGRMCSFGQGISLTPLQLGAYVVALANGGTLYYLQHPTTPEDLTSFEPRVKRTLDIARFVPEMQDGMAGAVEYGTARRLRASFQQFPVFGKTGTCSNRGTRFGWFASFMHAPQGDLVTVFFLEGGRPVFGPRAAELTGQFYKGLQDRDYFKMQTAETAMPTATETR